MMQTNETNFPEMLTIDQTAKRSGLSAYAVRKLARSSTGQAFTVRVGTKYLINQEKFAAFLNCEAIGENPSVTCGDSSPFRGAYSGRDCNPSAYAEEQHTTDIQPVPVRL